MNKKNLLIMLLSVILLYGCGSKVENAAKEVEDLAEQYIKDMDGAKTKEEVWKIDKEFQERLKFETSKISEEEFKEFESTLSWEEHKKMKNLSKETFNARDRAKERFNND